MKNVLNRTYKGFTIIEVMIVLAIAGLIMVIVFFAIPQLQRNQRDNTRQSVATRFGAEMETYAGNNQGVYPFSGVTGSFVECPNITTAPNPCGGGTGFMTRYITGASPPVNIVDPSTGNNTRFFVANATAASVPTITWARGDAWIVVGGQCQGENIQPSGTAGGPTSKRYAIQISRDRNNTFYCVDHG